MDLLKSERLSAAVPRLDDLDLRLLDELQHDVMLPLEELAKRVGSSKSACWRRIKQFLEDGLITDRVAIVNSKKVGLEVVVFVFVKVDRRQLQEFIALVRQIPEIVECHTLMGEIDLLLKLVVSNVPEYEAIWNTLSYSPGVTDIRSSISLATLVNTTKLPLRSSQHARP